MQLFIFLVPLPLHVSAPCSHLQVVFSLYSSSLRKLLYGSFRTEAYVEKNCIEKKPPEDGCMEPKHVVEEEQEI
jgi:hypothetical protein